MVQYNMFVDSHCHLDDPLLAVRLADVLAAGRRAGVRRYLVPGVSADGWEGIATIAAKTEGVFPAFGLHPLHAVRYDEFLLERLRSHAATAVAVGEIGLDYHDDAVPRGVQQVAFRGQLRLAIEQGLPVMLHCRHAFGDLLAILREEGVQRVGGVMHAFSGSAETASECIRLGLLIGVAGPITYRNAVRCPEVVRQVPLRHLLLETDAPDLTPEPYRGQVNEPAYLAAIASRVGEIKGVPATEVAKVTTANAERLFPKTASTQTTA